MMEMINKKRNKKGFTLIELVVVIAILGILAALAIPRLGGFQETANKSAVEADAKTIATSISVLAAEGKFDGTTPTIATTAIDGTYTTTHADLKALTGKFDGTISAFAYTAATGVNFTYTVDTISVGVVDGVVGDATK